MGPVFMPEIYGYVLICSPCVPFPVRQNEDVEQWDTTGQSLWLAGALPSYGWLQQTLYTV